MAQFFLELFSEEIPSTLQKKAREVVLQNFKDFFNKENINYSEKCFAQSTPNRLLVFFENLEKEVKKKSEEIKGPNIDASEQALEGFLRSNQINNKEIYKKKIDKGEFYFFKKKAKKISTANLLEENIPKILDKMSWKKSMKWGNYNLNWARPLKSILAIFNNKNLNFKFYHLESGNKTFIDKEFEDKKKIFKTFKAYLNYFKNLGVIIDQNVRKEFIKKEIKKISQRKKFFTEVDEKLLEEVTNLVEQPNVLVCKFDKKFLDIPKEILIITMQYHQKYFHTLDKKGNITNEFLVIANKKETKGFIKAGNERVIEARLNDAQFFWEKNKKQNLVKQVSKLKDVNYFQDLGSYFDKIQRLRKLTGQISDELLISKDKVELASSICKVDLMSDLVREFPELQGIIGGYFAQIQGFDKDVYTAIREHYLPIGINTKTPKKPYSIALALADKLDTLVGFFGINLHPTSSKDPYALRRSALGLLRLLIENSKELKIKDLLNYSSNLYQDQNFKFENKMIQKELSYFLMERLKYYMKEKKIRKDVIDASLNSFGIDQITLIFEKALAFNKIANKDLGINIISSYKRAFNILEDELKTKNLELSGSVDSGLFKNNYEKNLYKKIYELKKYFASINKDENYIQTLENLAETKKVVFEFFDNIKVNDENKAIQKNRLELVQMLCKTFNNYFNFSFIEST